jgi:triosephosphate isomerase
MKLPVIIVNFKTYDEVLYPKGLELAKVCELVAGETDKSIAVAPQATDLALTCGEVGIPVFAQHVDNIETGSHTGRTSPLAVKASGAAGTLLNHAEFKIHHQDVREAIDKCRALGLVTVSCADSLEEAKALAEFSPDFLAVEPPELIGGDISVTSANPEIVSNTVKAIKGVNPEIKVLCGAGVKTGADVKKAIELGTVGVLLASGVVKAKDQKEALEDLASGLA